MFAYLLKHVIIYIYSTSKTFSERRGKIYEK